MTNSLFNCGETVAKTQNRPRAVTTEADHWWQEMVSSSSSNGGSNQGSVSSEPRRGRQGQGRRGGNGNGSSGKHNNNSSSSSSNNGSESNQQQLPPQPPMGSRYKTEMCRQYIEKIKCAYGDKCQFAHGEQDLRPVFRHPKYKTEPCRSFNSAGYCPYGQRCHFVHKGDGYIQPPPASPPLSTSSGIGSDGSLADLGGLGGMLDVFTPPQSPEGRLPVFNRLSGSPTGTPDVFAFHTATVAANQTSLSPSRRLSEPDFGFYGF
ncbi:mRNA decay activator protein ZFP36L1 [Adelges cooleyi]|uniref:mRNA decay activator protein ZFP36L1 n=1 Tax=Adelges cooleyi TaxID=133065 RepID=UPI00218071B4|nr:mRNA decay activator protein ZFP36L1 [Adelges cooleyi]